MPKKKYDSDDDADLDDEDLEDGNKLFIHFFHSFLINNFFNIFF